MSHLLPAVPRYWPAACRLRRQAGCTVGRFRRWTWLLVLAGQAVLPGLASGREALADRSSAGLQRVTAQMETCRMADLLLRSTCFRIGAKLSERNRPLCQLPAVTFQQRTAAAWTAYQDRHRDELARAKAPVAKALALARRSFQRQFAEVLQGRVSMSELEQLQRELGERCTLVEQHWLAPRP